MQKGGGKIGKSLSKLFHAEEGKRKRQRPETQLTDVQLHRRVAAKHLDAINEKEFSKIAQSIHQDAQIVCVEEVVEEEEVIVVPPKSNDESNDVFLRETNLQDLFVCETCEGEYASRKLFDKHNCLTKKWICPYPNCKVKLQLGSKSQHLSIHEGVLAYPCLYCKDTQFNQKGHLQNHMKNKHSVSKPYACSHPNCGKRFKMAFKVRQHEAVHTLPFKCPIENCDKRFSQKLLCQRHIEKVHEGLTFDCPKCDMKFASEYHLHYHKVEIHPSKEDLQSLLKYFEENGKWPVNDRTKESVKSFRLLGSLHKRLLLKSAEFMSDEYMRRYIDSF